MRADNRGFRSSGPHWKWRIGDHHTTSNLQITTYPRGRKSSTVIIYNPKSGRFHSEQYFRYSRSRQVVYDGWLQDTLPAFTKQVCPNFADTSSLPVETSQTQLKWRNFSRPQEIVLNHPGSQYSYVGATGLAASDGKPTMTVQQATDVQLRMHGVIGLTPRGRKIVGVITPERKETWLIDDYDDLIDVGIVNPVPGRDVVVIRWQGSTPDYSLRNRYAVPIRPTPRRHPAFLMMTELAEASRTVTLDHPTASTTPITFAHDGTVRSGSLSGT